LKQGILGFSISVAVNFNNIQIRDGQTFQQRTVNGTAGQISNNIKTCGTAEMCKSIACENQKY
jgi:hypothetical protein